MGLPIVAVASFESAAGKVKKEVLF